MHSWVVTSTPRNPPAMRRLQAVCVRESASEGSNPPYVRLRGEPIPRARLAWIFREKKISGLRPGNFHKIYYTTKKDTRLYTSRFLPDTNQHKQPRTA